VVIQSPKYILFGEDDNDDQELLEEICKEIDDSFELKFINNGRYFISYLHQLSDKELPCLIVLDYNMPELNGAEILKTIGSHNRYDHIPKILWSTSNAAFYKTQCLELGASDYLLKPSSIKSLKEIVVYMLSFCKR
jgi:CheY-like chemotaxis protein